MRGKEVNSNKGVTLVEALVAAVAVSILALGALAYQYLGAMHFRIAHAELTATRAGQLLIEDWKGNGAPDPQNYDATELGVGFETPINGDYSYYVITVDGIKLHMWPTFEDIDVDDFAGITLRRINLKIQWRQDFSYEDVDDDDPTIILTTYARLGED
jgi:type II secretory pathway pseudopilin PulG